jgi:hypothetical protein
MYKIEEILYKKIRIARLIVVRISPTWLFLRGAGQSNFVKMTIIIPIFGSFILINDEISSFLYSSILDGEKELSSGSNSRVSFRLYQTYVGLTFLAAGSLVFSIMCPDTVKRFGSSADWLLAEDRMLVESRLEAELRSAMNAFWLASAPEEESRFPEYFSDEFRREPKSYSYASELLRSLITETGEAVDSEEDDLPGHEHGSLTAPIDVSDETTRERHDEETDSYRIKRIGIYNTVEPDALIGRMLAAAPPDRATWVNAYSVACKRKEEIVEISYQFQILSQPFSRFLVAIFYLLGFLTIAQLTLFTFWRISAKMVGL